MTFPRLFLKKKSKYKNKYYFHSNKINTTKATLTFRWSASFSDTFILFAGYIGVSQDEETRSIKPDIGWFITPDKDESSGQKSYISESDDSDGNGNEVGHNKR